MEIRIPKAAIIIMCGASCSGKTTLAKRIFNDAPTQSKLMVSADEIFLDVVEECPDLAEAAGFFHKGYMVNDSAGQKFQALCSRKFNEMFLKAIRLSALSIIDSTCVTASDVETMLKAISIMRGNNDLRPVILLKMAINDKIHSSFYKERRRLNYSVPENFVLYQAAVFRREVGARTMVNIDNWFEYAIHDPRQVEFCFG